MVKELGYHLYSTDLLVGEVHATLAESAKVKQIHIYETGLA
jgi:hypothetical protein